MGWRGENSQRIQQGSCSVLLVYTAPWRRSQASKQSKSESNKYPLMAPKLRDTPNQSLVVEKKKDLLAQRLRESDKATRCCGQYRIAKDGRLSAKKNFTICARTHLDKYIYIYIFFPKIRKKRGPSNVAQRANKNREALHILTLVFKFIWPVKRNKPLTLPKERTKTERFLYILTLVF